MCKDIDFRQSDLEQFYEAMQQAQLILQQYAKKELGFKSDRITARVKTSDDIKEKIIRKGHIATCKDDVLTNIDDIAGVRVVCDYLSEVNTVCDYINQSDKFQVNSVEDYISKPDSTGYRSCHSNVRIETTNYGWVKCEIQIRTTIQHSWAEKSHPLVYKKNPEQVPEDARKQLTILSEYLHTADKHAETIRDIAIKYSTNGN